LKELIRVVIADDEDIIRRFLKRLLSEHKGVEVVGEASNGQELLDLVLETEPQAMFVDIEMPDMDGITAAEKVLAEYPDIFTIFVTAHADFALKAFEISAYDYIVKPIDPERLTKTIGKIEGNIRKREMDLQKLAHTLKAPERLCVRRHQEIVFIDAESIVFLEKDKKKTIIHTIDNKYETNEPMANIEKKLAPHFFLRSHLCYIINTRLVEKVVPWGETYIVKFKGIQEEAMVSRNKIQQLYSMLGV